MWQPGFQVSRYYPPLTCASKAVQIKCRVETCQAVIVSQSFGRHLEFHPREDSKDRRSYGQGKFGFGKSKVVEYEEEYHARKEDVNCTDSGEDSN